MIVAIGLIVYLSSSILQLKKRFRYTNWIPLVKSELTARQEDRGQGIVFETWLEGNYGYNLTGAQPHLDTKNRYFSLRFNDRSIKEMPLNHFFFNQILEEQNRALALNKNRLDFQSTTLPDGTERHNFSFSQTDPNSFLFSEAKDKTSFFVYHYPTNQTYPILENIDRIQCPGGVDGWSDSTHEIIFSSSWDGTPLSPSGEMIREICIYNYEKKTITFRRRFPVDTYANAFVLLPKRKLIAYYQQNMLVIDLDNNESYQYDLTGKQVDIGASTGIRAGTMLLRTDTQDKFSFTFLDLNTMKEGPVFSFDRHPGPFPQYSSDDVQLVSINDHRSQALFKHQLPTSSNLPGESSCWYLVTLDTTKVEKIMCDDQIQKEYRGKDPRKQGEKVSVHFQGWL